MRRKQGKNCSLGNFTLSPNTSLLVVIVIHQSSTITPKLSASTFFPSQITKCLSDRSKKRQLIFSISKRHFPEREHSSLFPSQLQKPPGPLRVLYIVFFTSGMPFFNLDRLKDLGGCFSCICRNCLKSSIEVNECTSNLSVNGKHPQTFPASSWQASS